ncbi:MAG: electron transport complex subunit RsxC [Rikenellaceae bacterium]|nr:electron transport complex subunit RsxC [Rikenellaceae bacterium]
MSRTFKIGGVHPHENKLSRGAAIEIFPLPEMVTVPLSQHIGAPAVPAVVKGDKVKTGQLIASAAGFVSANIHSPVSGTVISVDQVPDAGNIRRPAVTIKVDGDQWEEGIDTSADFRKAETGLDPAEITRRIAEGGIVGMGGATFPTQVKLSVPPTKKAQFLLINGVECEPYLTADHRLMLEKGEELLEGVKLLARALGVEKSFIGIEKNKPDAIEHLMKLTVGDPQIAVIPLKVKYPQGGEKQLIEAVTKRQVPPGGLPLDVGVVVQNVGTAVAVYQAVVKRKPLIERVVTVTGKGIERPSNLLVRVGTPVTSLIAHCGGLPASAGKVIGGGPMMGRAISNLESPVTKGTSGILVMNDNESARKPSQACIKCAKCVEVCPMNLEPYMLYKLGIRNMFPEMEEYYATDCIECGSCSFTCPASLPLLDYIRLGKGEVMKMIRARKN